MITDDRDLHARIHGEYGEMPGLKLTLAQASRLFNVEPARCAKALHALVTNGVLQTDGGAFFQVRSRRV